MATDTSEHVRRLAEQGFNGDQIARKLGIGRRTVGTHCKRLGITLPLTVPSVPDAEYRRLHKRGLTANEIAAELNASPDTVRRRLARLGLTAARPSTAGSPRPRGESPRRTKLQIRLTLEELAEIEARAAKAGVATGVYARTLLFPQP